MMSYLHTNTDVRSIRLASRLEQDWHGTRLYVSLTFFAPVYDSIKGDLDSLSGFTKQREEVRVIPANEGQIIAEIQKATDRIRDKYPEMPYLLEVPEERIAGIIKSLEWHKNYWEEKFQAAVNDQSAKAEAVPA